VFLKARQFFPNLSHINPITVLPFYLFNNNFTIILTASRWLSSGLRPSGFHGKPLYAFPPHTHWIFRPCDAYEAGRERREEQPYAKFEITVNSCFLIMWATKLKLSSFVQKITQVKVPSSSGHWDGSKLRSSLGTADESSFLQSTITMTKQKPLTGCSLLHLPRDKENDKGLKDSRAEGVYKYPLRIGYPFHKQGCIRVKGMPGRT